MRAHLVRRGNYYAIKYYNPQTSTWSHRSLKTSKKATADLRFGQFLIEGHKKELLGTFGVEPVELRVLVQEFLDYMGANRSDAYTKLVRKFSEKWFAFFGAGTLSTAITSRMIQRYATARKKDKCKIKGTPIRNATVNRDLAALKHMLHKAEIWGYLEISPGRRVENLRDDGAVRTDYYTEEQLKLLVSNAVATRGAHPLNFNEWPEFIVLDASTGLRCEEMLFLEFSDIDWNMGVLHVRNKKQVGFIPKGRRERRVPLNGPAMAALKSMLGKKHAKSDFVFHQIDGAPWKSILESFRSLLKRCGLKRSGVQILRHTFGAHLAQKGVDMAVIRDLLGHHSVTLTEKYYAHLVPGNLSSAVEKLQSRGPVTKSLLPKTLPKMDFAPFPGTENGDAEAPLTGSFERCYVPEVALLAGVAKLAYAADSKSAGLRPVGVQVPPPAFSSSIHQDLPVLLCGTMTTQFSRSAVIIGASSGIGEALAHQLNREGWRLGLMARRLERLESIRQTIGPNTFVHHIDVTRNDATAIFETFVDELGSVDLVIISAGTGHVNPGLDVELDLDTVSVNVLGFMKLAQAAMRYFLKRGHGHLVGITSVAALRGYSAASAYAASKAFQAVYLDGLRDLATKSGLPIAVTEVQPGFVDTAMMKTDRPLSPLVRWLLVASPETAAQQIARAIRRRAKHAYITRRYALVAFVARLLPRPG